MKKLILILTLLIGLLSCNTKEFQSKFQAKQRLEDINYLNDVINDTFTLCDGHIYYRKDDYNGDVPIHSQYCKH